MIDSIANRKLEIDLGKILGEGGEGIVFEENLTFMKKSIQCAIKVAKHKVSDDFDGDENVFGKDILKHFKESMEYEIGARLQCHNNIKYLKFGFVEINGEYYIIIGN